MIEVQALAKQFKLPAKGRRSAAGSDPRERGGWFEAVRNVSFRVASGEIAGLIGPNGAGKTTSLRLLSTALVPSGGRVSVDGVDLVAKPEEARRRFGFLSGSTGLYARLTVRENLRYFGEVHGMGRQQLNARIDTLLDQLQMGSYADRRAETLSAGMRQRALIARTVIHSPNVLILDEPTTGLDILGAELVLDFMQRCRDDGAAVIFSTHNLHEIEALCRRVSIIHVGETVFDGEVETLRKLGDGSLPRGYLQCIGAAAAKPAAQTEREAVPCGQ